MLASLKVLARTFTLVYSMLHWNRIAYEIVCKASAKSVSAAFHREGAADFCCEIKVCSVTTATVTFTVDLNIEMV